MGIVVSMQIIETGIANTCEPGSGRATLTFPTFVPLSNGTLLATCRAGSAKDCDDEAIEFFRSTDQGATWSAPWRPFGAPRVGGVRGSLKICYLTERSGSHLIAAFMWVDRQTYPGQGLFNPETEGCLPMVIMLADSHDFGQTWSPLSRVPMPADIGPPSLTNPLLVLDDGSLAMSIETNKMYGDASKWYQRVVLRHSGDAGRNWGSPVIAGFDPSGRIHNWDQRVGVAPDGRLVTFLWTYDTETSTYLNIHRRISADSGRTWSEAEDLGFADQPSHPAVFPDGRVVLAWVDRFQTQTIRARLSPAIDAPFDPASEVCVYQHPDPTADDTDQGGALGLSVWSFGLPYAEALPNGEALVVYYAGSEEAMDIHWARIRVDV